MSFEQTGDSILVSGQGKNVARITLNRAAHRNPLDKFSVHQLNIAVQELEADPAVSVVVIRGAGGHFSSGGDMKGYIELYKNPDAFKAFLDEFHSLLNAIETSRKTYVAVIEGYCVAGGLELLLACDIVVAASSAKIGDGHLKFGQLPGAGGSQRLPRAVGPVHARMLMLTGEIIDAAEAVRIGLVSRMVPDQELEATLTSLVDQLSGHSPLGLAGMKHLINVALNDDLATGLSAELEYVHNYATTSEDATEGLRAFQEKRAPCFTGR
jgi:enoyl-CoA hydratase/carnithine racemase